MSEPSDLWYIHTTMTSERHSWYILSAIQEQRYTILVELLKYEYQPRLPDGYYYSLTFEDQQIVQLLDIKHD